MSRQTQQEKMSGRDQTVASRPSPSLTTAALSLLLAATACAADGGSHPFGVDPVQRPPTQDGSTTGGAESTSGTREGASSGTGSEGSEAGSASSGGPTDGVDAESTTTTDADGGVVSMSTSTGVAPEEPKEPEEPEEPHTQPKTGQYSACVEPTDCGFAPHICISIDDAFGEQLSGFCTEIGCLDPVADCDPNPGGTAVPVCIPAPLKGLFETSCALDCSGGGTCPAPMQCFTDLDTGPICG